MYKLSRKKSVDYGVSNMNVIYTCTNTQSLLLLGTLVIREVPSRLSTGTGKTAQHVLCVYTWTHTDNGI